MKTRAVLVLAAVAFATLIPIGYAKGSSFPDFQPFILDLKPAASSATVRADFGEPDAKLGPWIWIYWNFGPNRANPHFDTLVIAFENDRVIAVKITDGRVVRQLLAQAAKNAGVAAPAKR